MTASSMMPAVLGVSSSIDQLEYIGAFLKRTDLETTQNNRNFVLVLTLDQRGQLLEVIGSSPARSLMIRGEAIPIA